MYKTLQILGEATYQLVLEKDFLNHQQYQPVPTWKVFLGKANIPYMDPMSMSNSQLLSNPIVEQCSKTLVVLGYIGDENPTQLNGDYFHKPI